MNFQIARIKMVYITSLK